MDYFWLLVRLAEDLAIMLLLFALLTACVVRWRWKKLAVVVLAGFILSVIAYTVLGIAIGHKLFTAGPHFNTLKHIIIVAVVIHVIGYITIAWIGWRRHPDALPAAATWPRLRLLLALFVSSLLALVTHWNITLAVHQRLAREEVEARVVAMSVLPGRPIDSLNAAMIYEPVFERIRHDHRTFVKDDWLEFDKPLDTNDPALRELLASHGRDLDAVVRASIQPQCYFGIRQPRDFFGGEGDFSWIGPMHAAGKLLAVDTRVRIADGDLAGATRNTSAMFRIARHVDQTPILISVLVSCAIDRLAINCAQALLNHPDLSAEMLSELQLEARADYRRILRRASVLDEAGLTTIVKRISAEGFDFLDEEYGEPGQRNAVGTLLWTTWNVYFIEHELEVFRSTHRQYRALLDQPWPEASVQHAKFVAVRRRSGVLAAVLIPAWESAAAGVMINDARQRQARLAIAMRRYELEHGELPESFDDLSPSYMEEVPLDPSTEELFQMEDVEGGVRLYSAGIEAWDREEYPGNRIKDSGGMVEMFLKTQK